MKGAPSPGMFNNLLCIWGEALPSPESTTSWHMIQTSKISRNVQRLCNSDRKLKSNSDWNPIPEKLPSSLKVEPWTGLSVSLGNWTPKTPMMQSSTRHGTQIVNNGREASGIEPQECWCSEKPWPPEEEPMASVDVAQLQKRSVKTCLWWVYCCFVHACAHVCMCICLCIYIFLSNCARVYRFMYTCVHMHVEAGGQRWVSFSNTHHLTFYWDRVSSWTRSSQIC